MPSTPAAAPTTAATPTSGGALPVITSPGAGTASKSRSSSASRSRHIFASNRTLSMPANLHDNNSNTPSMLDGSTRDVSFDLSQRSLQSPSLVGTPGGAVGSRSLQKAHSSSGRMSPALEQHQQQQQSTKRPTELRAAQPDVIVVVGGQEFHHHTAILAYASEYFDLCLSSGMKESKQRRVEFPDRDPEEWKFVYSFLEPDAVSVKRPSISTKNIPTLLPWFDFLGLRNLMKRTDLYLKGKVEKHRSFVGEESRNILENFDQYVNWWDLCEHYQLMETLAELDAFFGAMIYAYPLFFTKDVVSRLKPCLLFQAKSAAAAAESTSSSSRKTHSSSGNKNGLWDAMVDSDFIPQDLLGRLTREEVIHSPTFADMVEAKIMCQKFRFMNMGDVSVHHHHHVAASTPRTPADKGSGMTSVASGSITSGSTRAESRGRRSGRNTPSDGTTPPTSNRRESGSLTPRTPRDRGD